MIKWWRVKNINNSISGNAEKKRQKLKICRKGLNLLLCGCNLKNLALQSKKTEEF